MLWSVDAEEGRGSCGGNKEEDGGGGLVVSRAAAGSQPPREKDIKHGGGRAAAYGSLHLLADAKLPCLPTLHHVITHASSPTLSAPKGWVFLFVPSFILLE